MALKKDDLFGFFNNFAITNNRVAFEIERVHLVLFYVEGKKLPIGFQEFIV